MSRFGTTYLLACKLTKFNQPCYLINSKFVFICCEFTRRPLPSPYFAWRYGQTAAGSIYGSGSKVSLTLFANFRTIIIHSYKGNYVVEDWHHYIGKYITYKTDSYIFQANKRTEIGPELLTNIHCKIQPLLKTKSDLDQIVALVLTAPNNDI